MISGAVPIIKNFCRSNFRSKHMENNACTISLPAAGACHEIFGPGKYFVRGGRKFCNFLSGAAINCPLENKASLHQTVLSFP